MDQNTMYVSACVKLPLLPTNCTSLAGLMWGWGLLLCMAVTVKEQLYGPYPTKNLTLFAIAYGGYIIMPLMVMLRVAWSPVFKTSKASDKKKTKTH